MRTWCDMNPNSSLLLHSAPNRITILSSLPEKDETDESDPARPEKDVGRGRAGLRRPLAADEFTLGRQPDHGGGPRVALYHRLGPVDGRHHGPAGDFTRQR